MLTPEELRRIQEIEAREKAATPPGTDADSAWWYDEDGVNQCCMYGDTPGCDHRGYVKRLHLGKWYQKYPDISVYDAEFVCASRSDIPFLLGIVRRTEAALKLNADAAKMVWEWTKRQNPEVAKAVEDADSGRAKRGE